MKSWNEDKFIQYGGFFVIAIVVLWPRYKQYLEERKLYKIVKKLQVKDLNDINPKKIAPINNLNDKVNINKIDAKKEFYITNDTTTKNYKIVRVRVSNTDTGQCIQNIPFYKNEQIFYPPNPLPYLEVCKKKYNDLMIRTKIQDLRNINMKSEISGLGEVHGEIFEIQTNKIDISLSIWNQIYAGIAIMGEWILQTLKFTLGINGVTFKGPLSSILEFKARLKPNMSLVILIDLDLNKNTILPLKTALSKQGILCLMRQKINKSIIDIICCGSILILIGYMYIVLKRRYGNKDIKKLQNGYQVLQFEDPKESQLCIICSSSCRNVIFMKCMHFMICQKCSKQYPKKFCLICRSEITNRMNVYSLRHG